MLEYLGLLSRALSSWYRESQKSNQKVEYWSVNVNWELTKSWKSLMTSPLPVRGQNYPLIGVFALVCVLINDLFALESIPSLYSVSKQSFLGIFALSFLSRLNKCEEGVRRQEDKVFSPLSLLPLASLTMADFPAWLQYSSMVPAPVLVLGALGWPQLLGSDNSSILCHSSIGVNISMASCHFYYLGCLAFPYLGSHRVCRLTNASVRFSLLERSTVFFSCLDYKWSSQPVSWMMLERQ